MSTNSRRPVGYPFVPVPNDDVAALATGELSRDELAVLTALRYRADWDTRVASFTLAQLVEATAWEKTTQALRDLLHRLEDKGRIAIEATAGSSRWKVTLCPCAGLGGDFEVENASRFEFESPENGAPARDRDVPPPQRLGGSGGPSEAARFEATPSDFEVGRTAEPLRNSDSASSSVRALGGPQTSRELLQPAIEERLGERLELGTTTDLRTSTRDTRDESLSASNGHVVGEIVTCGKHGPTVVRKVEFGFTTLECRCLGGEIVEDVA